MTRFSVGLGLAVWFAGRPSWALCPNCLGQSPSLSSTLVAIGVFLLIPPAVFFAVAIAIRKLAGQSPPAPGDGDPAD